MKVYDAVVIGSGCGMIIVDEAMAHGLEVALVDKGPLGGTCPNLGCIPSKMLIYPADRVVEIQEDRKFGIVTEIKNIDFNAIMKHMRKNVLENQRHMRKGIEQSKELAFYEGEGHFTGDYTLEIKGEQIKGKKIFIAAGSRTFVPPIKGLDSVDYLTSDTVLQLTERPDSLIIIGGGYIAAEYGHFFAAMGTKVTMLEMMDRLITAEEPDISAVLQAELGKRMEIHTGTQVDEVKKDGNFVVALARDKKSGQVSEFKAQRILVAVGRKSNADLLKVENTGVQTDEKGYVKVNELLETNQKNIFAVGDINGQQLFTHMANRQASIAAHNAVHRAKSTVDFSSPPPHAIFTHPQIAAVGLTEEKARKDHHVLVGRAMYSDAAGGEAMMEEKGFAKAVLDKDTEKILGFHIIGPYSSILIQEVINAMATGGHVGHINAGTHIHPALPELIVRTLSNLEEVS